LSSIEPGELIEYLGREGNSAEIVQWKYFDSRFNANRERGYAWVKDGRIGGFIGLIPFQVWINGRIAGAAWTCDWSVQDQSGRGTGILLIRQAQEKYEFLTQLGGNEATQRIISRLAAITVNDAGMRFYLPLRLGAILRLARRRLPQIPLDAVNIVNRLPMRLPRKGTPNEMIVEPGVSGLLVQPGDAAALAGALKRLASEPALAARLGEAGRRRLRERFTWEAIARRWEEVYNAAVAHRR